MSTNPELMCYTLHMKQSVVVINGGVTFPTHEEYIQFLESCEFTLERFRSKDWKDTLVGNLPDKEVLLPKMPNSMNARYSEWKIWFEKTFPLLTDTVVLVGHSMGGIFLAKYLTENVFPKTILSLHLVAAPYDTEFVEEFLGDFELSGSVDFSKNKVEKIFLYQSKDDTSVAYQDVEKYKRDLPSAILRTFEDRGHFNQETFPELIEDIKQ